MFNCISPTNTCWCFTLVQRRQTWLRMKYVSFVLCSLLLYLPHLKDAGNLFAQKASFINCTKDLKQISLLQIFVYFRKMFLGRRRKWSWKIWVDIVRNILPEQLSRCQCTEGQKPLGQEDHLNPTEKLQLNLSHYFVFLRWNSAQLLITSHPRTSCWIPVSLTSSVEVDCPVQPLSWISSAMARKESKSSIISILFFWSLP